MVPGMCRCSGTGDGGRLDPSIEIVDSIQVRACDNKSTRACAASVIMCWIGPFSENSTGHHTCTRRFLSGCNRGITCFNGGGTANRLIRSGPLAVMWR